jgi:hypothetical protein
MSGLHLLLPGTGRWRAAPEGALLLAGRLRPTPSTTSLRVAVPLPVPGRDS